jgi:hypothetical protein
MRTKPGFAIRCGTPDCDWGFTMPDLSEVALDLCYAAFLRHCAEMRGLNLDDPECRWMYLDLEDWTLTLRK